MSFEGQVYRAGYYPRGERAHVVQVGLGDNRTFLHELVGQPGEVSVNIKWLLSACSGYWNQRELRGIAVEPVRKHFEDAESLLRQGRFANVSLVQVALGQWDGTVPLWRVEAAAPEALAAMSVAQREHYDWDMSYLRNMSCVGDISSHLEYFHSRLVDKAEVAVPLRKDTVQLWSWRRLAREMGFHGCEVLVLDTEGCDVEILRSMAYHCWWRPDERPWLIQFESNGLSNERGGGSDESAVVAELEDLGYMLVGKSKTDTHLVLREKAVEGSPLHRWMQTWRCSYCGRTECYPYLDEPYSCCSNCRERPSRW
ncbi:SF3B4 [Symbiodinium natans]|uniref:SF3B4 protein n=1 Tax=Symbiodinium natans TaxID=878477 RepID=A0A812LZ82_9DINO|nr:SF3B4 [Symbiodinium natans]